MGCAIEAAVGVGYSDLDSYGIHALELYQSLVERRRGGEVGVRRVKCVPAAKIAETVDQGRVRRDLLEAALRVPPAADSIDLRALAGDATALFLFEYDDGFTGAVFMLPGVVTGCRVAVQLKRKNGRTEPPIVPDERGDCGQEEPRTSGTPPMMVAPFCPPPSRCRSPIPVNCPSAPTDAIYAAGPGRKAWPLYIYAVGVDL